MGVGVNKQDLSPIVFSSGCRLVVPVMGATGGSGRSTVADLLAERMAAAGAATVVLDTAPRLTSPWPSWTVGQQAGGLAALPPDRPLTRSRVRHAAAVRSDGGGPDRHVLTDGRDWHSPPLVLPDDPAAWLQLAAIGGWQCVVADTPHPVAHDVLESRCAGRIGRTRAWYELPYAVPVLCASATAGGVQALQQAVMALHADGMPLRRTVVALVAQTDGRLPAVVRAGATMLSARTAAVVHLPHDPHIRSHGLRTVFRLRTRTRQAAGLLCREVLAAARASWGTPLPDAPRPAPSAVVAPS
uniref:CobQ/CobB/MinD/ParA nucleotide binding domain-containing protein n=1 Tax=Streptomyces pratensis (strain ATCC 33331 / IAF-45CD) TaxID=591167 RepID=A0A8D3WMF5_STRFA